MMLALESNVARPKTAIKRRGGHTAHEMSHHLLCVLNVTKRKRSADITSNDTFTCATIDDLKKKRQVAGHKRMSVTASGLY